MNRFPPADVERLVRDLAVAAGVPRNDAAILAEALVDADVPYTLVPVASSKKAG